ncbi:MAG TPA: hypothetical protein VFX49_00135, partial [Chloroflexota bacterium]|nr:hypothetical protein [Chloroflexota bacterium]
AAQIKGAWCGSTLLRLTTTEGRIYLKSAYTRPPGEAQLVAALAARWPDALPDVIAHDATRNLLLMRDFGDGMLRYGAQMSRWENAARGFGALQLACSSHLDEWLAMGCEDRRLPTLMPHFERLLADTPYLWPGHERGLTEEQTAQVRSLLPRLAEMAAQLGASGIPDSLVQQDFRHGNLAVVARPESPDSAFRFVYYDWGDAVVSHPFFSGTRMLDYLGRAFELDVRGPSGLPSRVTYARGAIHRYLRDAYVEPWTALAPARDVRAAFDLARKLNPLWQTVRWWLEIPYYETASPWGRDSLTWGPNHLRRLLREMEEPARVENR